MRQIYKERKHTVPGFNTALYEHLLAEKGKPLVGVATVQAFRRLSEDGTCRIRLLPRMKLPFLGVLYFRKNFPYRKLFNRK